MSKSSFPTPVGKRPELTQSGWSWPRLVSIHDPMSPPSRPGQTPASASSPLQDPSERPPDSTARVTNVEDIRPLSPVLSAGSSAVLTSHSDTVGTMERPSQHEDRESESSIADSGLAANGDTPLDTGPDADSDAGSNAGSDIGPAAGTAAGSVSDVALGSDIEVPVAYEGREMTAVSLNEKAPATPAAAATTPITEITKFVTPDKAVKGGVSVPSNSIPYYATPKIMVHKPSQSSETEASGSRTIDEVLGKERRASFQQELPRDTDLYSATPILRLVPVSPRSTEIQAQDIPNELKLKKRKRYLRKLRNAAARPTILKASLGRQLATPTKQALRILAIGESVTVEGLTELTVPTKQAERLLAEGQNITLERLAESAISPKQAQMLAADGENFTNIALKGFAVCS